MIQPTEVNHPKFPVDKVLFDDGEFSIVWGSWEGGTKGLGMRWNESPQQTGFPVSYGKPAWLVIPLHLSIPFVTGLLGQTHSDNTELLMVLQELEASGALEPIPK